MTSVSCLFSVCLEHFVRLWSHSHTVLAASTLPNSVISLNNTDFSGQPDVAQSIWLAALDAARSVQSLLAEAHLFALFAYTRNSDHIHACLDHSDIAYSV